MNKTELLKKAINTYGVQAQKDMMIEEMSELTKAILKERRALKDRDKKYIDLEVARGEIKEEIADVQIMLNQMKIIYGSTNKWENLKLQRLENMLFKEEDHA